MTTKKLILSTLIAGAVFVFSPTAGHAATSFYGNGSYGDFTGSFNYVYTSPILATLTIDLKNTTPSYRGGYLTAFVFNNPDDLISHVTLTSSDSNFKVIGGSSYDNKINGSPYGHFDIGASTGGGFEGSGNPDKGIGVGDSASFVFTLQGSNLDTLSNESFADTLSGGTGHGEGYKSFVARFRGMECDKSDKVPARIVTPEPPSLALFAMPLLAGIFLRKKINFAV
ncbi:MAG: hypothetical protein KGJ61_01790 [Candidatus Omnitrophica bacterium]|nr:hypothetical protein [Candidatus Omnitrophota bacterium]